MPMIGRGDRNRVDAAIVEEPADVGHALRAAADLSAPLVEHALVDIAQAGNLEVWNAGVGVQVILAAPAQAAHPDAYAIVGAEHALRPCQEREAGKSVRPCRHRSGCFEEVPSGSIRFE